MSRTYNGILCRALLSISASAPAAFVPTTPEGAMFTKSDFGGDGEGRMLTSNSSRAFSPPLSGRAFISIYLWRITSGHGLPYCKPRQVPVPYHSSTFSDCVAHPIYNILCPSSPRLSTGFLTLQHAFQNQPFHSVNVFWGVQNKVFAFSWLSWVKVHWYQVFFFLMFSLLSLAAQGILNIIFQ